MGKYEKFRQKLLDGGNDNSIDFETLCQFLKRLGFSERINGSHHIFYKDDIPEILNIQSKQGKAKPKPTKSNKSETPSLDINSKKMTPIKYELIVYWSEADDVFIVEVPELAGCMADGQSYAEAIANAEIIIRELSSTKQAFTS